MRSEALEAVNAIRHLIRHVRSAGRPLGDTVTRGHQTTERLWFHTDGADAAVIRTVPDAPIYSATGEVTERFSSERLAADLTARGIPAKAVRDNFAEWEVTVRVTGKEVEVKAHAEDTADNVELRPHVLAVETGK